jgi:hypothetical protein
MDDLTEDYRRASAADAGAPSAATRAAILAEARAQAAARPRPVAANQPRHGWRTTANVAASVLLAGVALLVWRQVERPPGGRRAVAEIGNMQGAPPAPKLELPPPAEAPAETMAAAPAAPARHADAAQAQSNAVSVDLAMREPLPETAILARPPQLDAPAPSADAAAGGRTRELAVAKAAPAPSPPVRAEQLLRRQFPALLDGATPPTGVWLLLDAGGNTVRSGTLQADEDYGAVTAALQRAFPGRGIGAFEVSRVPNARGATVQVGVARLE